MPRTTYGLKSTRNIRSDGSTSMLARRLGTTHDYTLRDGGKGCPIALPSRQMAQQMSRVAMCERQSTLLSAPSAQRKSCYTLLTKFETFDGPTWPRMSASD